MIHDISITEDALRVVASELRCNFSNLKRLLGIVEHTFKPFDKVLVRDHHEHPWKARFFEAYTTKGPCHFQTTDSTCWKYCIPYEGNEDKLNNN